MRKRRAGWPELVAGAFGLGTAASSVVALRMAKLAKGGAAARRESARMVEEKLEAAFDAGLEAATSVITGKAHRVPARVLALYRKRVAANMRRLTKKPRAKAGSSGK